MRLTLRTSATIAALALGTAVVAGAAAQVCHPDAAGTRSFTVKGAVTSYGFTKGGVAVRWTGSQACAGSALWNFQASRSAKADTACARTEARLANPVATKLVARHGDTVVRVRLAPRGSDRPDRLEVVNRATHEAASWPLIDRPTRVALYGDLAVLSTVKRHAVYALRITDGRIALVGITQPADRPVIGAGGLLYQDDSMVAKDRDKLGRLLAPIDRTVTLKLVPLATVRAELDKVGATQVSAPISSFSMDGPRVAYAVSDPRGACDQIRFWNIPWRFVSVLTKPTGASCLPSHAPGGITNVALAGSRALWTTTYGSTTRVLAASIINCEEWVVARPGAGQQVTGLAGDGPLLTYALARSPMSAREPSSVSFVPRTWRGVSIVTPTARPLALATDQGRVAVLDSSGRVTITTSDRELVGRVHVGDASAISLQGQTLVALGNRGTLNVYRAGTGELLHSWRAPSGASSVDLQYGIAVISSGRNVFAMNVATGNVALVFRAPAKVAAQIESPGVAVQYNAGRHGYLGFVPMSRIEAATR